MAIRMMIQLMILAVSEGMVIHVHIIHVDVHIIHVDALSGHGISVVVRSSIWMEVVQHGVHASV